jgi:hypothetical protein
MLMMAFHGISGKFFRAVELSLDAASPTTLS